MQSAIILLDQQTIRRISKSMRVIFQKADYFRLYMEQIQFQEKIR